MLPVVKRQAVKWVADWVVLVALVQELRLQSSEEVQLRQGREVQQRQDQKRVHLLLRPLHQQHND
jgi:hypothetical protein